MRDELIELLGTDKLTVAEIILKEQEVPLKLLLVISTKTDLFSALNLFLDSMA